MRFAPILIGIALIFITGTLLFLLKSGGALRSVGVIGPTLIGDDRDRIPKALALRMYPEFDSARDVVWYVESAQPDSDLPQRTHLHYQKPVKPAIVDLRQNSSSICEGNCWYIQEIGQTLPDALVERFKRESNIEIYVDHFDRSEEVPSYCDVEKILENKCVRPISLREVKRKMKASERHFFMRRYLDSKFFVFIER